MKFSLSTITIQQIQIFFAVVESNGFTNAGISLHLTQSTISKSISKMENDLNVQLFVRSTREMHLTEAGEILYKEWKQQMEKMNSSYHHAHAIQGKRNCSLHIGLLNTVHPDNYFYPLLERFKENNPDIQVIYDSGYIKDLEQKLENWLYDAIIVPDIERKSIENRRWRWKYAAIDRAYALMSAEHPLADRDHLEFTDLLNYDQAIINIGQKDDNFLIDLRERFARYGMEPRVSFTYDDIYNLRYLLMYPDNAILFIDNFFDYSSASEKIRKIPVNGHYKGLIFVWKPENRNIYLKEFVKILPLSRIRSP